ncbi:MAG: hypothetical protein U5L95_04485 [Candidatus Saccharibacteria bacterium]|nr:hypothetical protein [Candidatus Saccharibacteria bacterium]
MRATHEIRTYDPEKRREEDFVTLAAEMLEGQMRTPTEYEYDPGTDELIAEDGSRIGKIFDDSLDAAKEMVSDAPQLSFELRRRKIEREEYDDMLAMMRGDLPNTMVVVSDFPPELMDYPEDVGGYNVTRKQTMLRVITKQDNKLHMYTQSLDRSDRDGLESMYQALGFAPEEGELLGQRMHVDLDAEFQEKLVDELTNAYDATLRDKHGGNEFKAGRRVRQWENIINTYDFVRAQTDILHFAMHNEVTADSRQYYDIVATIAQRYAQAKEGPHKAPRNLSLTDPATLVVQYSRLEQELSEFGQQARAEGKSFSACGVTLEVNDSLSGESQLDNNGYGNKTSKEEKYNFDAYRYCVSCQAPPKGKEKKKMCGPCGLCRSCDKKAGGKG